MQDNTQKPPRKKFSRVPLLLVVLLLIVAVGFIAHKLTHKHQGFPITIGATRITTQDVTNYANEIKAYQKLNPSSDFGGSPTQVAINDLVLNAAFKDQAQKLKKPLTDADLESASYAPLTTAAQKQQYIASLKAGTTAMRVRAQNLAYEQKFENNLIIKKTLMIAGIDFDTPYFARAPKAQVQSLYDQAQARLKNTVMPLLQKKASDTEIGNHVDLSFKNGLLTKGEDNYQQYFQKAVMDIDIKTNYTAGESLFNDINSTSYIRGNVGKLYSTNAKINSLKNVGDYTDVFSSKAGIFMVIRLDAKNGGTYNSWGDFLAKYKQQYGLTSTNLTKQFGAKVSRTLNNAVLSLASIGEGSASADIPGGCGQHNVEFTGRSWDTLYNTPIGGTGTTFNEFRPPGGYDCPGTVSGNASATTGGANNSIFDNCFAPAPSWSVNSLAAGYTPVSGGPYTPNPSAPGVSWDNSAGGQSVAVRSGGGPTTPSDGGNYIGFPIWTPGTINNTGHVYLYFLYQGHPPQCNDCSCNNSLCVSSTTIIACTNVNFQAPPTEKTVVWVTDSSGNRELPPTTIPDGAALGTSFQPKGQVLTLHAYDIDSAGHHGGTHTWSTTGSCMGAQCSVDVDGNLPDGSVLAGSNYTVRVTFVNTSQPGITLPSSMPANTSPDAADHVSASGHDLDFTQGAGGGPSAGGSIAPGGSYTFTFAATASSSPGASSVGGYPDYYGNFGLGPSCSTGFNVETRAAACSIDSVSGPITPGNYVQAGQAFTVSATITDTGTSELALSDNGNPLSLNYGDNNAANSYWTFPDNNLGVSLFPGQSIQVTFTLTANLPSAPNPAQEALWAHVAYSNDVALGGQCTSNVDMYVPFSLSGGASAIAAPNDEDPTSFAYKTWVNSTAPVPVDGSSTSTVYKTPAGTTSKIYYNPPGTVTNNGPFGAGTTNILNGNAAVPPPVKAGDTYNAEIDLGYTAAYVGANGAGDIVGANGAQPFIDDFTIIDKPFFKTLSGGIEAGGGFSNGGSCSGGGTLGSWNNDSGLNPEFGASSQLDAVALGNIVGLSSRGLSGAVLSFANTGAGVDTTSGDRSYSPALGGNYGGTHCLTSYAPGNGAVSSVGNTAVSGRSLAPGQDQTVYVTGDAYITGNITYQGAGGGWTPGQVPSFTLIATGNIYIDPSVTELDGIYTSQPVGMATGGTIYTCGAGKAGDGIVPYKDGINPATPYAAMAKNELYDNCNKQLTINGNFVAKQIDLMRTFGSLRDDNPSVPPAGCSNYSGNPVDWLTQSTCAAEVFNLSPELYLSTPVIAPPSGGSAQWDALTSLPPVL